MRVHTSKVLTILKSTIIVTLFCFSSTLVHAMEEDEESSTLHRVIPEIEPELPSILIPSAQPKDPMVELQRELDLARLQRQVAEERRKALAEEELLAAELSAKIPDAKQSLPPPVDPLISLLTAFGGGRSQQQVKHNVQIETSRLGESISNLLIQGKFKSNKRLEKDEKKKQRRAASSFPSVPMTYEDYFKDFLPKMGKSCRAYNNFQKTDEEILAILFPGLPHGTYPDQETATKKFAELARNGRTYAKLFNPPKFPN